MLLFATQSLKFARFDLPGLFCQLVLTADECLCMQVAMSISCLLAGECHADTFFKYLAVTQSIE